MSLQQKRLCLVVCLVSIIIMVSTILWLTIEFWSIIINEWVPLMTIVAMWYLTALLSFFIWRGYKKICLDCNRQKIIDRINEASSIAPTHR